MSSHATMILEIINCLKPFTVKSGELHVLCLADDSGEAIDKAARKLATLGETRLGLITQITDGTENWLITTDRVIKLAHKHAENDWHPDRFRRRGDV